MEKEEIKENKWGKETLDNQNLIKLLQLRKDYANKYRTNRGFPKEGWDQISKDLGIGKNGNACRKRFIDIIGKYKMLKKQSNVTRRSWPLFEFVEDFLESCDDDARADQPLDTSDSSKQKRSYFRWDDSSKIIKLVELRRDYDKLYRNSFGFLARGWDQIAEDLDIGINGLSCRKKYSLLLKTHKLSRKTLDEIQSDESIASELLQMVKADHNELYTSCIKDNRFAPAECKTKNAIINEDRSYFKWESEGNHNIHLMLELVAKYIRIFPPEKRKGEISSMVWKSIATDFDHQTAPDSIRKKFCSLMKTYRIFREDETKDSNDFEFFNDFEIIFGEKSNMTCVPVPSCDVPINILEDVVFEDETLVNSEEPDLNTKAETYEDFIIECNSYDGLEYDTEFMQLCSFCSIQMSTNSLRLIDDKANPEQSKLLIDKINCVVFGDMTGKFDPKISNVICDSCVHNIDTCNNIRQQCLNSWDLLKPEAPETSPERKAHHFKHKKRQRQLKCPYNCGSSFLLKDLLISHIKCHLNNLAEPKHQSRKLWKCSKCKISFRKRSLFHKHLQKHRINEEEFLEDLCCDIVTE